jgi:hypothetical protein
VTVGVAAAGSETLPRVPVAVSFHIVESDFHIELATIS